MRRLVHLLVLAVFALTVVATAQQQDSSTAAGNPLVRLLQSKGVITEQEAATINQAGSAAEQQVALSKLLVSKGIISQDEYKRTTASVAPRAQDDSNTYVPVAAHVASADPIPPSLPAGPADQQKGPAVIPAVAPIRLLQSEPAKPGGLVPDIRLGSGARVKIYGFVKATAQYDTSDPGNLDFILPGFGSSNGAVPTVIPTGVNSGYSAVPGVGNADGGPFGSPQFRVEARQSRVGMNFEWPDLAGSKNTLTGRIEADFEGNYSRAQNRNVSSGRTNMFVLRTAWARIDHRISDHTNIFALFGMDWTPFASSTVPNMLESTGLGVYFGNPYERAMQFRAGLFHDFGGSRHFAIGIEPAIVAPMFGNLPADLGEQLGVSERQGFDSTVPEVQGRVYFQWQLDKAKGVAPAQIIFSGTHARRAAVVTRAALAAASCGNPITATVSVTGTVTIPGSLIPPSCFVSSGGVKTDVDPFLTAVNSPFFNGAQVTSQRYGVTAEIQLPTRYVTLVGKAYNGEDLRFYFANQIFSTYNSNTAGLMNAPLGTPGATACGRTGAGCPTAFNIDASSTVVFGFDPTTGAPSVMPQVPVRTDGWFAQLAFPLSRIFGANPEGRNAGWTIGFTYGIDQAKARDVRLAAAAGGRAKSDMGVATLFWKLNQFVTFGWETSYWRTFSACTDANGVADSASGVACKGTTYRGLAARQWHDFRNQFGPTFTF